MSEPTVSHPKPERLIEITMTNPRPRTTETCGHGVSLDDPCERCRNLPENASPWLPEEPPEAWVRAIDRQQLGAATVRAALVERWAL